MIATADLDTARIQQSIDLYELASRHTKLSKKGVREWAGPCPFCKAGDDRFSVQPDLHRWQNRCGCTKPGYHDAWYFFTMLAGGSAKAGYEAMLAYCNQPRPVSYERKERTMFVQAYRPPEPPNGAWQTQAQAIIAECEEALWSDDGKKARLLLASRGIYPVSELAASYHLGYCKGNQYDDKGTWGRYMHNKFVAHGLVLPWIDSDNRVWAVNIRHPAEMYKQLDAAEQHRRRFKQIAGGQAGMLYGWQSCTLEDGTLAESVLVVEGELDALLGALTLRDMGIGVVTFGAVPYHTAANIRRELTTAPLCYAKTLLIATDADEDGEHAAHAWLTTSKRAIRLAPIGGKDIGEMVQAHGTNNLRAWLDDARRNREVA